jgi:hypothetical protein
MDEGHIVLRDRTGREVRLTDERLSHCIDRLRNANLLDKLQETLEEPDLVVRSNWDEDATLSYRFYPGTRIGDKWLCIVVKEVSDDAFVLTAYPTDRIKEGKTIWKKT